MGENEIFERLALALALGILIGVERGWHERSEPEGGRVAGLRSFALTGLLSQQIGPDRTMLLWGLCIVTLAMVVTLNPHVRHARPIEEVAATE